MVSLKQIFVSNLPVVKCDFIHLYYVDLDELLTQLKTDYDSAYIRDVCPSHNGELLKECCFKSASPISPIIVKFDMIARRFQTDLFDKLWQNTLKRVSKTFNELNIQQVVTEMWEPTLAASAKLIDSFFDRSIKLSDVDIYFKNSDRDKIQEHIYRLHKGVQFCYNNHLDSECPGWIKSAVHLMHQYWALQKTAEGATLVLELKQKLNLHGDFSLIEVLADKVHQILLLLLLHPHLVEILTITFSRCLHQ